MLPEFRDKETAMQFWAATRVHENRWRSSPVARMFDEAGYDGIDVFRPHDLPA